jgi:hypothetical protein
MAGKDDIRLLSSYVYSKVKGLADNEEDVHAVGAVVMNRATQLGSLAEAIQTMSPTPDMIEVMQGNIAGRGEREYKRVIQLTSKLLRGYSDPTGGAIELAPKRTKMDKSLGLVKTHATKHHNFYRPSTSGGLQSVSAPIV